MPGSNSTKGGTQEQIKIYLQCDVHIGQPPSVLACKANACAGKSASSHPLIGSTWAEILSIKPCCVFTVQWRRQEKDHLGKLQGKESYKLMNDYIFSCWNQMNRALLENKQQQKNYKQALKEEKERSVIILWMLLVQKTQTKCLQSWTVWSPELSDLSLQSNQFCRISIASWLMFMMQKRKKKKT